MNAIEYRYVQMAYGEKIIIPDFSLSIAQGEFVTIIGSSGCGKTTILKRVGIARPLAASPEMLLMDEPFGAVDLMPVFYEMMNWGFKYEADNEKIMQE